MLALTDPAALAAGLCAGRVRHQPPAGGSQEHVDLLEATQCDAGDRLIIADLPGG